jgi:hypothetical protein
MGGLLSAAVVVALSSCNSKESPAVAEGGGVGAPCSADSQCTGYSNPGCLKDVKPIAGLVDAGDPSNKIFVDFHVPFPGGYCSNTIENSCTSDADCGEGGGCFRPFEGVGQDVIDNLNAVVPFDVNAFSTFALCLKPCTAASECRTEQGYACEIPLKFFMGLIKEDYKRTFCFVNVDDQIMGLLGTAPDTGP